MSSSSAPKNKRITKARRAAKRSASRRRKSLLQSQSRQSENTRDSPRVSSLSSPAQQPTTDAKAAQAAVDLLEFTHRQQQFLADAVAFSREVLAAAERATELASAVARGGHTSSQRRQQAEINQLHATTATEAARSVLRLQIAVQEAQRASIGAAAAFAHRHEAATFLKIDDDSVAQSGSDTRVRLSPEADEDSGQEFFDGIAIDAADHLEENDDDGYYDQWERGGGRVW